MGKDQKINKVLMLYEKLTYHIENDEHSEEKLLRRELSVNKKLRDVKLSLTESHVIACIGDNEKTNGTFIAKSLNITKGGVSKAAAKLLQKGMIDDMRQPDNRKEVYYVLTELGREVYLAHAHMHEKSQDDLRDVLDKYSENELDTVSKFLSDFMGSLRN